MTLLKTLNYLIYVDYDLPVCYKKNWLFFFQKPHISEHYVSVSH